MGKPDQGSAVPREPIPAVAAVSDAGPRSGATGVWPRARPASDAPFGCRPRSAPTRRWTSSGRTDLRHICRHCARSSQRAAAGDNVPGAVSAPRAVGAAPDDARSPGLEASPFHGEGYRTGQEGIRQERVRRLMREHDLQAPHRVGRAHGPKAHDGTITTEVPDVMWGTDMTATMTVGEGAAFVFVAVDHCTTECIGLHAAARTASRPWSRSARSSANASATSATASPAGCVFVTSNYLADDFQQEVAFFGIESSPKICCGCGASTPSRRSAWPCSSSSGRQWMLEEPRPGAT